MSEDKKTTINYAGNSHKAKESEKDTAKPKVEKIISGEVVQRKKPLGRKIAEAFSGDDVKSVGSFILMDVFLPQIKTMISDAASQGVERMLFGDSRPRSSGARGGSYTSYNRVSSPLGAGGRSEPRTLSRQARASHDFGEVVLQTRGEAEEVLDSLQLLVEQYDIALVSDLYDLVGVTSTFTDNKWGWTNLAGSGVRRVRDGYLVDLPRTVSVT